MTIVEGVTGLGDGQEKNLISKKKLQIIPEGIFDAHYLIFSEVSSEYVLGRGRMLLRSIFVCEIRKFNISIF